MSTEAKNRAIFLIGQALGNASKHCNAQEMDEIYNVVNQYRGVMVALAGESKPSSNGDFREGNYEQTR